MMNNILTVNNIWLAPPMQKKGEEDLYILDDIALTVARGVILGISGESGSGKTSLAKILAGIIKPTVGSVTCNFTSSAARKSYPVQLLFQNNEEIINPYRTVKSILTEALNIESENKTGTEKRLNELMTRLQIDPELLTRRCRQLSGGERQRVALARLLAVEPEVLILDEPFSAQDVESQMNLLSILRNLKEKDGITIICISHLLSLLKHISDEIIIINNGRIVET